MNNGQLFYVPAGMRDLKIPQIAGSVHLPSFGEHWDQCLTDSVLKLLLVNIQLSHRVKWLLYWILFVCHPLQDWGSAVSSICCVNTTNIPFTCRLKVAVLSAYYDHSNLDGWAVLCHTCQIQNLSQPFYFLEDDLVLRVTVTYWRSRRPFGECQRVSSSAVAQVWVSCPDCLDFFSVVETCHLWLMRPPCVR